MGKIDIYVEQSEVGGGGSEKVTIKNLNGGYSFQ